MSPSESLNPLPKFTLRASDSHKGDYGRALLIGGSRGMAGAIALAGMASLRGGAGLVRLALPDCCLETVAGLNPCYMTVPLPGDEQGKILAAAVTEIQKLASGATALAYGPGLGRSADLEQLTSQLYEQVQQPMVIDADGLNGLASRSAPLSSPGGPRILTPHLGEFARLAQFPEKTSSFPSRDECEKIAKELANEHRVVIVLKGNNTLITDGKKSVHNPTGNPGMATGGTGDVLTGTITALLCQSMSPFDAARLGVYVHGLAGDLAAQKLGQVSLTALDVVDHLPQAISSLS